MAVDPQSQTEVVALTIPSRLELLGILDKVADQLSQRLDVPDEVRSAISMSVIEAGTNAIQHGHNADPSKAVEVRFEMTPEEFVVVVRDGGTGFNIKEHIHDVTSPDHLLDLRGRGIFIMQTCMDKVEFDADDEGTTVRMIKHLKHATNGSTPAAD